MKTTAPLAAPSSDRTVDATPHEHGWSTASRHATSEGWIAYSRCAECGAWRAERLGAARAERFALSRVMAPPR